MCAWEFRMLVKREKKKVERNIQRGLLPSVYIAKRDRRRARANDERRNNGKIRVEEGR